MRRPRGSEPKITSTVDSSVSSSSSVASGTVATRAIFNIHNSSGCTLQCLKLHPIGHVISVQSYHFALRYSEHEVSNKASAVISVQLSARHLRTQCRQCTKSQALELEDHPSHQFSGFVSTLPRSFTRHSKQNSFTKFTLSSLIVLFPSPESRKFDHLHVSCTDSVKTVRCLTVHGKMQSLKMISMPKRSCSCSRRVFTCPNSVCCILPMEPCACFQSLGVALTLIPPIALSWCQ